ncbi:hypothetical protein HYZ97_03910 [Candidatus Pacearchaeota archaeon]|nr:hypothetical protein [Candidatus Pacearchaeota archaeon]
MTPFYWIRCTTLRRELKKKTASHRETAEVYARIEEIMYSKKEVIEELFTAPLSDELREGIEKWYEILKSIASTCYYRAKTAKQYAEISERLYFLMYPEECNVEDKEDS